MGHRSLVLAIAAFSSLHVAAADAQSVYVAPGGVYVGGGPVYVTPAPAAPYAAPTYGYGYGPPAVAPVPPIVAPPPAVVAPTASYGAYGGYYDAPISAYAAEFAPRPPAPVPYYGVGRCAYGGWPPC
jgi:hypothetical protein